MSDRSTPDVADATCRLVRAIGNRLAGEDPELLLLLVDLDRALHGAWETAVAGQRAAGFPDREIAAVLGVTRQALQQRHPRPGT